MGPTFFERAFAVFAPDRAARSAKAAMQLAASRELAETLRQLPAPAAASPQALSGDYADPLVGGDPWACRWMATSRSVAAETMPMLPSTRAAARALIRGEPIAASWINTKVVRAVGTGLALSAQPNRVILGWSEDQARDWKHTVHSEFSVWADSQACDWYGRQTFYDLQDLILRSTLESGDSFSLLPDGDRSALMPYRLRVQVLEADRVGNPAGEMDTDAMVGGIRFKPTGGVDAVHVYDRHPGGLFPSGSALVDIYAGRWYPVVGKSGRRAILHHFKQLRPEQPRGIPDLAPVMQLFRDLNTYKNAEIKAAIVSAFVTMVIETPVGTSAAPIFNGAVTPNASATHDEIAMGAGSVIGLQAGEKATFNNPNRPNAQFGAFVDAIVHQLGAASYLGSEMLMKRYNTSYVAARAAFLDAWKHLLDLRTMVARTFCQPVFETWMAESVSIGRIPAPGFFADPLIRWAYTRAVWSGDSQGSINPKDEVAAYRDAIEARLCTRERAEWELFGTDWSETYDTKKAEESRLRGDDMLPVPKAGAAVAPAAAPEEERP